MIFLKWILNDEICFLYSNFPQEAIFKTDDFTIFLDLKPNFPEFRAPSWSRGGKGGYSANYADIYAKYHNYEKSVSTCLFNPKSDPYCPRFRLEDIVMLADVTDNDFNETAKFVSQVLKIILRRNM